MNLTSMRRRVFASVTHIPHHDGTDFALYASMLFAQLPRPVLLELGRRATEAIWDGLGGFTDSYNFAFEGNVVVVVNSNFALAAEYKQQPTGYHAIGNLERVEDDWWTIDPTTHQQLTPAEPAEPGVTADYLRLCIGLEDVTDIQADIEQALQASQQS